MQGKEHKVVADATATSNLIGIEEH